MRPRPAATLAALGLAVVVHLDWHLARPDQHDHLSGHWSQHWLLALPSFVVLAFYPATALPTERWRKSAVIILAGAFLGQILEPLSELALGASWSWIWGGIRWTAFAEFMAAGLLTFLFVMAWRESRSLGARKSAED
jgi:cell division protein FtsW (lipid II flippase)